jgi:putative spermidine/putrescine transport system ATP-binding protein
MDWRRCENKRHMSYLELSGLTKRYRDTVAVERVSLAVTRGESVALLGPSGCGKTTTLRMLAGLIEPDEGSICVDGADVTRLPAHRRNMGYVFQSYALFPHLNVLRNVGFGLEERGLKRAEIRRRVDEALALVRLGGLESRKPRELSGGQQQRVALARALVILPSVLLLDESLSNLDARLRDAMRQEIRSIQRKLAITTLLVTHDQVEALVMCDRVAVMNAGRIVQVGTPTEIYEAPATRFVAGFVGRANWLAAKRNDRGRVLVWGTELPIEAPPEAHFALFVRPQRIRLVAPSEPTGDEVVRVTGRVARTVFVGDYVETVVQGVDGELSAEAPSGQPPLPDGAAVAAVWKVSDMRVFAPDAP